ncbi:MAG TPA: serine/threonine-protein kinase, partial [Gemmataceae bacterium]|nr:serine/threonine-protein kinase [Gemmataceae bacterium]
GAVIPGGGAVVDLVEKALDCAHETLKDNLEASEAKTPPATAEDLQRVAEVLDVLNGDLGALTGKIASLEKLPLEASRTLEVAMATDVHCQAALRRLDDLARRFDRLEEQNRQLLKGQGYAAGILDDMLPLMKRTAGVADFVEEMRSAGLTLDEFRKVLREFQNAARALQAGRIEEAGRKYLETAKAQPTSAATATALAAVQMAEQKLPEAEETLARAVRLRSDDAELAELHRQVTSATRHTQSQRPAGGASERKAPKIGDVLDGWRLDLLLGAGGWGQVFKASRHGQVRALKVMHPDLSQDPAFVDRFKQEIATLFKLRGHKHLVEIDNFGYAADAACWYFLMEFIDGQSLQQMLQKKGPLSVVQGIGLFLTVADGLAAAHAQNIVHRDVKPANILVRRAAPPVLVDFGLAAPASGKGLTTTGRSAGCTVMFAAPEQLRGKPADARTDVYCLAASLYYALNYDKPEIREPDQYEPRHAPEQAREALTQALEPKPERRPPNAAAFRELLRKGPPASRKTPVQAPPPKQANPIQPVRTAEARRAATPPPLPEAEEILDVIPVAELAPPPPRMAPPPDQRLGMYQGLWGHDATSGMPIWAAFQIVGIERPSGRATVQASYTSGGAGAQGCLTGTIADNGALMLVGAVHGAEGRWDVRIDGEIFFGGLRGRYTSQFHPNGAAQSLLAMNAMFNPVGAAMQAAALRPKSGMFALQKQ